MNASDVPRRSYVCGCAYLLVFAAAVTTSSLVRAMEPPVDRIAFAPQAGTLLPGDARFRDEAGRPITLNHYFGVRPLIVVLAYYGCSNLCGVVLEGLATSLKAAQLRAGRDVEVIVASIAPLDTPELALQKKRSVLQAAVGEDAGWHFLTGYEDSIERLAAALDYRYVYDEGEHQYAHAAGIVLVTRDGRVSRTLYGVAFAADALRNGVRDAALAEPPASDASSAATWLLCFHYDPRTGRYDFVAMSAVRLVALAALLALGAFITRAWLNERGLLRRRPGSKRRS